MRHPVPFTIFVTIQAGEFAATALPPPRSSPRFGPYACFSFPAPRVGLEPVQNPHSFAFFPFFSAKLKQNGKAPYIGYLKEGNYYATKT
jgi:hypothetical protein